MFAAEYRLGYARARTLLAARLAEPPPGRIQLLAGPRQIGKTTLLLSLSDELGDRALYVPVDGPEGALPGLWERTFARAEQLVQLHGSAIVLLDEVHLLHDWAARLKGEWDRLRRRKLPIHVVATGSSSLRLGAGSKESLAGRFERITMAHWSASELAAAFGGSAEAAAHELVRTGSYPGAFSLRADPARWKAYVRDAIVEPAVGRDLLALGQVRKPALLRQVFAICAASPAQIVSLQKLQGQLQDRGALETIAHYLALLEEAFLVAPLAKLALRAHRQRAAPPKLVALNNGLLAAMSPADPPDPTREPDRFGAWVENACLAHAWNAGQRVSYWREEPLEVDAIFEGTWGSFAVEIKAGPFAASELAGLAELSRRQRQLEPLVLCDESYLTIARRAGIRAKSWLAFLIEGP
jgi:uncharacterized protein